MPLDGLSLLGFLDQTQAVKYLRELCVLTDASPNALLKHWSAAKARKGPAVLGVEKADVKEVPAEFNYHLETVKNHPRFAATVDDMPWSFKMVEIAKLLAFQFHVETGRTARVCAQLQDHPTVEQMLRTCLPVMNGVPPIKPPRTVPQGIIIESEDTNFAALDLGYFGTEEAEGGLHLAGFKFGERSPFTQVVGYCGRYYLRNGFHRANGLMQRKATHIPCILLEASDYFRIGIPKGGGFSQSLLGSSDPPTCSHFAPERAYPVKLRSITRAFLITVAECSYLSKD